MFNLINFPIFFFSLSSEFYLLKMNKSDPVDLNSHLCTRYLYIESTELS